MARKRSAQRRAAAPNLPRIKPRGRSAAQSEDRALALAAALRLAYEGQQLTQQELAGRIGVKQNTISRWVRSVDQPSLEMIAKVENACGRPRGFVLRAAGFVSDTTTVEDAIAADPALSAEVAKVLLAAYREAVQQARGRRRATRSHPE